MGARNCVELVIEKYTSWSAGTAPSKVTPFAFAAVCPTRCSTKYSRSFSFSAVVRSLARPSRPALPFLPIPPLNTGLMNTEPCRSISALISSSLASGPSTSAAGKPANASSLEPYSIPVTCISLPPDFPAPIGARLVLRDGADTPGDCCRELSRRRPPAHVAGAHVVLVDRAVYPSA